MRISTQEFRRLVAQALQGVPEQFQAHLQRLAVDVEQRPDDRTLRSVGLSDERDLLGLYEGVPLTERSVQDPLQLPERVVLYQQNIQRICRTRRQVIRQIRTTVLHEIGHHFGLDEDDLEALGYE